MPIDTSVPNSDGWVLDQLYRMLRVQEVHADLMYKRYKGDPPLPDMNPNQKEAVKWFIKKARTNFERLIVSVVLSRLRIRGIRTAVDPDEGGDAEAFTAWKRSRGKMWSKEAHKMALTMGRGFVMVGIDDHDKLLVTAEDPRKVAILTDPADPLRVEAALKLTHDPVDNRDIAHLFRLVEDESGVERVQQRIATRERSISSPVGNWYFDANAFGWATLGDENDEVFEPPWLQAGDGREAILPIVPFVNEDGMAEFEPHLELLDRITQQILQRMTIATIQAFRQRAMKGLPKTDPETGEEIDYDSIFIAEPGAIWDIPASVEIWESREVNLQPILLSIRDDIKDLVAVSGTPLYTLTPDAAQGSAEGASLQRETLSFKVEDRQDMWELPHERVAELIFRTLATVKAEGDDARDQKRREDHRKRSESGTIEIMWAPGNLSSISERANGIAQTKGVIPVYLQLTEIFGMDPAQADRAMTMLQEDSAKAAAMAAAAVPPAAPPAGALRPGPAASPARPVAPREQRRTEPSEDRPARATPPVR